MRIELTGTTRYYAVTDKKKEYTVTIMSDHNSDSERYEVISMDGDEVSLKKAEMLYRAIKEEVR